MSGVRLAFFELGGPVSSGLQAFIGRGNLQIRRRRLGNRAAGGGGSSKLCRVSQEDDVDVSSFQFLVKSSVALSPASG